MYMAGTLFKTLPAISIPNESNANVKIIMKKLPDIGVSKSANLDKSKKRVFAACRNCSIVYCQEHFNLSVFTEMLYLLTYFSWSSSGL